LSLINKDVPNTVIPEIQHNVNLRPYNTLSVDAFAERFVVITAPDQLSHLYEQNQLGEDTWVLGGGSNVLFKGKVKNLVLKNEIRFLEAIEESGRDIRITVGGGNDWHRLVKHCVEKGWGGIENLALIPGTVGAAPIQNIGAYGVELKEVFVSLSAFDLQTGRKRIFKSRDCEFGYRDSVFKKKYEGRFVILSVTLKLAKPPHVINSHYKYPVFKFCIDAIFISILWQKKGLLK
jgi:UDP-N-acetylmuramate dehydrogenase